jgi:hypothetical protein
MEDAVERYCAASAANDMAGLADVFAPGVELPSPLIGSAVFKGREDVATLLGAVYGVLGEVKWDPPVGSGRRRLAVAQTRISGLRIDDAMVFELDDEGRIERIRPHLRPLLAMLVFMLRIGPAVARRPGIVLRALRG